MTSLSDDRRHLKRLCNRICSTLSHLHLSVVCLLITYFSNMFPTFLNTGTELNASDTIQRTYWRNILILIPV